MKIKQAIIGAAALATAVIAAALLATAPVTAQPSIGSSILAPTRLVPSNNNSTNRVAGSTAYLLGTNSAMKIDASGGKDVALMLEGNLIGAGTTDFGAAFSRGISGTTNREIIAFLQKTAAGTTKVFIGTNITIGAFDVIYWEYVTNYSGTGASYLTNMAVSYKIK